MLVNLVAGETKVYRKAVRTWREDAGKFVNRVRIDEKEYNDKGYSLKMEAVILSYTS